MIYISGDTHGDFRRFSSRNFPQQKQLTRDDYVIILGDFGGIFSDSAEERYWLKWLSEKNFTILWIDGNHENFDLLNQYPLLPFHGGYAHQIRENIYHLCRGCVFCLDGCHFFVMGGAQSHDSILLSPMHPDFQRMRRILLRQHIAFRVEGQHRWTKELPNNDELQQAWHNLSCLGSISNLYILSHCAPTDIQRQYFPTYPINVLTDFLMMLRHRLDYRWWFCGHYHENLTLYHERFQILYNKIIPLK